MAVIGGGAAGTTLALALSLLAPGRAVDLYEPKRLFHNQLHATHRFLHPHIYDWPGKGVQNRNVETPQATLPILSWKEGDADTVARELTSRFEATAVQVKNLRSSPIAEVVTGIGRTDGGFYISSRDRVGRRYYHSVFVTVGFGFDMYSDEKYPNIDSKDYWEPEVWSSKRLIAERRFFVSGNGDGGLVDLLAVAIGNFRHREFFNSFLNIRELDSQKIDPGFRPCPVAHLIHPAALEVEKLLDGRNDVYKVYESVFKDCPWWDNALTWIWDCVEKDHTVYFHTRRASILRNNTSPLNRMLVFMLLEAAKTYAPDKIMHVHGDLTGEISKRRDGKKLIVVNNKQLDPCDVCILRHGPRKTGNFEELFKSFQPYADEYEAVHVPESVPLELLPGAETAIKNALSEVCTDLTRPATKVTPIERPKFHAFAGFPIDKDFRGRRRERKTFTEWLHGQGDYGALPILELCAMGGTGKSNLAWIWAKHDVAGEDLTIPLVEPNELTDLRLSEFALVETHKVLWFSFYATEGGGDFNGFLEEALVHLSTDRKALEDYHTDSEIDYAIIQREVIRLLGIERSLVIWDGAERLLNEYATADPSLRAERSLEDVQKDPGALYCQDSRVAQFLWHFAAQSTSKLLISTRLPFDDLVGRPAATYELSGLDSEGGVALLEARGIEGPKSLKEKAVLDYAGHPHSLHSLANSLLNDFEFDGDIRGATKPVDTSAPLSERRRNIFDVAFGRRSIQHRQLLSRMSRVRGRVDREVVRLLARDIPGLPPEQLGQAINDLVRLRLVSGVDDTRAYEFHPVTRRYIYYYPEFVDERTAMHDRLREHFAPLAKKVNLSNVSQVAQLTPRIEEFYHAARAEQFQEAVLLFKPSEYFKRFGEPTLNSLVYYDFCDYHLLIELLEELFPEGRDHPPIGQPIVQGTFLNDLSHAYGKIGREVLSLELLERALNNRQEVLRDVRAPKQRAHREIGKWHEGLGCHAMPLGKLKYAHKYLKEARKSYAKADYKLGQAVVTQSLGMLFGYLGEFGRSRRCTEESIAYLNRYVGPDHARQPFIL